MGYSGGKTEVKAAMRARSNPPDGELPHAASLADFVANPWNWMLVATAFLRLAIFLIAFVIVATVILDVLFHVGWRVGWAVKPATVTVAAYLLCWTASHVLSWIHGTGK